MASTTSHHDESAAAIRVSVESGPHRGLAATWNQPGSYLIGRAPHAHLALVHDIVASLEHCRLEITPAGCLIRDLGSRQGTTLNGRPITESTLRSGDTLELGMSELRITMARDLSRPTSLARDSDQSTAHVAALPPRTSSQPHGFLDIPGYRIKEKLGQGGMGVVYDAQQVSTGRRVAIKTIVPAAGTTPRSIQLFEREMKVLAGLTHPRIVRHIESGQHAGQIYLVMEYVECVALADVVEPLPRPKQIAVYCGIIAQVLEALQHAHEQKLVHRDVKPGNILVTRAGKRLQAKLADFGLAKNFELAGLSQLTADNEIRGTLAFMPWEQLNSSRYARPSADIYSATATLFYFLIGRAPGHTQSPKKSWLSATSLFSPSSRQTSKPRTMDPTEADFATLPPTLADVLRQGLAAEPSQRFATAAEMREALIAFRNQGTDSGTA